MSVVSKNTSNDLQKDQYLKDTIINNDKVSTLGTIHKKKPLPKIPLMKASLTNLIIPEGEILSSSAAHNGFISVGPSWTTGTATTSNTFTMNNEMNINNFTESPTTLQQPLDKRYTHHSFLNQSHLIHTEPYYSRHQPTFIQQETNGEWKTSVAKKPITRSDSLKVETSSTSVPVPFSKAGHLPLKTHLEKPYEPTSDDFLQRKISKEELFNFDMPTHSVLLQKLNQSTQLYHHCSDSSTNSSNISTPLTSISATSDSQPPIRLLGNQQHRHSMPLLNTHVPEDTPSSAAEHCFQPNSDVSPISFSSRIPSPWGTSRSATVKQHRVSTGSIPNLMSAQSTVPTPPKDETKPSSTQAEQYFNEEDNRGKYSLSIASCSLINIRSNTKLYRRMAIKTRNKETQMTYARYLLQISKLYENDKSTLFPIASSSSSSVSLSNLKKNKTIETPAETRHRLLSEAGYWIERLAKAGHPEALYIKGRWHLLGPLAEECTLPGYEKIQEAKAFKCFQSASKAGWVDAHYELAHLWKKRGNYTKAIHSYERGAREKHTLSIYKMAKILLRGQLKQKRDIPKGLLFLKQAADMNDIFCAEPAFVLGCIHANEFDRIGIQRNVSEAMDQSPEKINYSLALKYLKKSAQHGYPDAIYFMGQVSETGMLGQLCDSWQAYQHYMKAAEVKHAGAMLDLSRIYSQGISGLLAAQKDMAFKWCKRSADLGFDQAEYVLGKYYEDGIGVTPDFPLALEYFGKAASKGYQLAAEKLNRPLADGTRRRLKRNALDKKDDYLSVVISDPKVKRDDDDDHDGTMLKINNNTRGQNNNICTIQ